MMAVKAWVVEGVAVVLQALVAGTATRLATSAMVHLDPVAVTGSGTGGQDTP